MKTGPFAEHSNQLWNISAVPSWSKVNQGLIRMYKAEASPSDTWGLRISHLGHGQSEKHQPPQPRKAAAQLCLDELGG
ncbi:PTPA isoform 19 [Pan troglodytes]|uniref:Serine/threonine-protein phosphatase 2A activator n=3 Tax=Pan TaxID=9596 RepID=A0A2I3S138_PANTR|nr:PTPA isoform 19 [Pan troglodytes]